ncbi:MAG: hypothetical protein JNL74_14730 [Fibrobacteres bacterium]|nr:hypothetical protein [Fibrobacterota bacterium]
MLANANEKLCKEVELDLMQWILVLLENKKKILIHFICVAFLAVIVSMLLPKSYKATTVFLPPEIGGGGSIIASLMQKMPVNILGSNNISKRQIMTILESRELREEVIRKFDLVGVYKTRNKRDSLDLALKKMKDNVMVEAFEDGGLGFSDVIAYKIDVIDKNPERCSDMANYFVDLVDEKVKLLNSQGPSSEKAFIEEQIKNTKQRLDSSRIALKVFQQTNKIFDVPEQIKYAVQATASLRSEITSLEMQRAYLLAQVKNDPSVEYLEDRIKIIRDKISTIETSTKPDLFLGLNNSIDLGNRYADLYAEVETQSGLLMLLLQQFEQAKIQEANDVKSIRIIDRARIPQKKHKPKRAFYVLGITFFYMVLLTVNILLRHKFSLIYAHDPDALRGVRQIKSAIFKW